MRTFPFFPPRSRLLLSSPAHRAAARTFAFVPQRSYLKARSADHSRVLDVTARSQGGSIASSPGAGGDGRSGARTRPPDRIEGRIVVSITSRYKLQ